VTHECDYPLEASDLPHLTRSVIPPDLQPDEIDRQVRERTEKGEAIFELDSHLLEELQPDLVPDAPADARAIELDLSGSASGWRGSTRSTS
jgi:hypothetical protein